MTEQTRESSQSRGNQILESIALGELLLIEAAIESAMSIGEGFGRVGRRQDTHETLTEILRDTSQQAADSYSSRYRHFQKLMGRDRARPLI